MFLLKLFSYNWADPLRPDWASDIEKYRTAFEIFKMPVYWYSIMILLAVVLSVVIGYFGFAKRLGATTDYLFEGVVVGVICGIAGGRLWYVIADVLGGGKSFVQPTIIETIKAILNIRTGGLAISGAVILAGLGVFIFCKVRKIKVLYILEIVLPLIMLSQVLGRWGNFFNFEAHGGLINVPGLDEAVASGQPLSDSILQAQRDFLWFLPDFIIDRMYITQHVDIAGYYHPCFFYEGAANFIGFTLYMILRRVVKKGIYVGDGIGFYLIWYGVVRFFIESMRTDAQMVGNVPVVMIYTPIMVVLGITWLIVRRACKIKMITCYEALYGFDSTVIENEDDSKKKNKKQKGQKIKVQKETTDAKE